MLRIGDKIAIFDNDTLLLSGEIIKATDNPKGYSVDGILFFNPNSNKFIIKKQIDNSLIINMTKIQSGNYILINNNNIDNSFNYDFFMWNEIEPEVKETVELLNRLSFVKTYSSCSGHKIIPSYIDFYIVDYDKFFTFINVMNKYGLSSYCFKHGELEEEYKFRFIIGVEGKRTCHLELVDINSTFDKLNSFIKKYLKLQENGIF